MAKSTDQDNKDKPTLEAQDLPYDLQCGRKIKKLSKEDMEKCANSTGILIEKESHG